MERLISIVFVSFFVGCSLFIKSDSFVKERDGSVDKTDTDDLNIIDQIYDVNKKCSTNEDCGEGEFCEFPIGECGGEGRCVPRDSDCDGFQGGVVCGCDGRTYDNDCERRRNGVSKYADGICCDIVNQPPERVCNYGEEVCELYNECVENVTIPRCVDKPVGRCETKGIAPQCDQSYQLYINECYRLYNADMETGCIRCCERLNGIYTCNDIKLPEADICRENRFFCTFPEVSSDTGKSIYYCGMENELSYSDLNRGCNSVIGIEQYCSCSCGCYLAMGGCRIGIIAQGEEYYPGCILYSIFPLNGMVDWLDELLYDNDNNNCTPLIYFEDFNYNNISVASGNGWEFQAEGNILWEIRDSKLRISYIDSGQVSYSATWNIDNIFLGGAIQQNIVKTDTIVVLVKIELRSLQNSDLTISLIDENGVEAVSYTHLTLPTKA